MRLTRADRAGRAALILGAAGIASPVFALSTSPNNNFVDVEGLALLVFPVLGAVAVLGVVLASRPVVLASGAGFVVAALVQLAQFGRSPNWLGGNGSTFSLLLALGTGLLVLGLTPSVPSTDEPHREEPA